MTTDAPVSARVRDTEEAPPASGGTTAFTDIASVSRRARDLGRTRPREHYDRYSFAGSQELCAACLRIGHLRPHVHEHRLVDLPQR